VTASALDAPGDLPSAPLVVAAIQATPTPGDVAGNAALAARLVAQAAEAGARLAVLPELFLPAYHPPTLLADPDTDLLARGGGWVEDPRLEPLSSVAREYAIAVVVGAAVRYPDGRRTCAAVVVGRGGEVRAAYAKQHLWGNHERALFAPGRAGATLVVDDWQLGLGVCYDGCFPEHARAATVAGAHGYLCPSGYVVGSAHRRDVYYAARALDNTVYVAFANSVGGEAPWEFNGGAALYDPQGQPLARAADEGEAVLTAIFDPEELARVRRTHTMLADRIGLDGPRWVIEA
jgi:5-aminopentanamidase